MADLTHESALFTDPVAEAESDSATDWVWHRNLIAQVRAGRGFSSDVISESSHFELQVGLAISKNTIVGIFYGPNYVKKLDTIFFPATGYTEKRTYDLETNLFGLWTNIQLSERLSLVLAAAISNTNSELAKVESDGPLTIEPGHPASSNFNLAYRAGLNYVMQYRSFGFGPEIGYSSSSSNRDAEVKEFYGSLLVRFDSRWL